MFWGGEGYWFAVLECDLVNVVPKVSERGEGNAEKAGEQADTSHTELDDTHGLHVFFRWHSSHDRYTILAEHKRPTDSTSGQYIGHEVVV